MKTEYKSTGKIKGKLLSLLLPVAMVFTMLFALPPITVYAASAEVGTYGEFTTAVADAGIDTINITNSFSLEGDVTIDRSVTITSDSVYTIRADTHSLIIASGGSVSLDGSISLTGVLKTVQVSSGGVLTLPASYTGTISATETGGKALYVSGETAAVNISGGTVSAADGAYGVLLDNAILNVTASSIPHIGAVYFHLFFEGSNPVDDDFLLIGTIPAPITMNVGEVRTVSVDDLNLGEYVDLGVHISSDEELNPHEVSDDPTVSPVTAGNFNLVLHINTSGRASNVYITIPVSVASGFAGGSGTSGDPWEIETAAQLDNVRKYLGNGNSDKYFELMNNIDLSGYLASGGAGYNNGKGWVPIGNWNEDQFTGHFNGDGHTISGLYIDSEENHVGLFGYTSGSAIQNVGLADIDLTGNMVGGLAGYSANSSLTGCYATGVVNGGSASGGLVGVIYGGSVSDCYAMVDVNCSNAPGGLAGALANGGEINNCYAAGTVTGSGGDIGGLVGATDGGIAVTVNASYYNSQTNGQSDSDGRGEPKSSFEMVRQGTYSGWDFNAATGAWAISEGESYPYLQAMSSTPLPAPPAATSAMIVGDSGDSRYNAFAKTLTINYGNSGAYFSFENVTPADGLVMWSSSDTAVAGISPNGDGSISVEPVSAGTATISLNSSNGNTIDSVTVIVEPIHLTVSGDFTVENKEYDGNTSTIMTGNTLLLDTTNCVSGDETNLTANFAATFSDSNAGQNKTVSLSTSTLTGSAMGNYVIDLGSAPTTTATITPKELTIGGSFTAQSKEYDGTTNATIASNNLTLVGKVGSDDVTLVPVIAFDTPDIATGKTVSLTAGSSLTGAKAENYTLSITGAPTYTSGVIASKLVNLSGSFTVDNKEYNGDKAATIATNNLILVGIDSGDDVSIESVTAEFDSAVVGNDKTVGITGITLTGANVGDYAVSLTGAPTATANIVAKPLTITGSFTAEDRQYNGMTNAEIDTSTLSLVGVLGIDDVDLNEAAAFADKNAGTWTVTLTGSALTGADAVNYTLDFTGAPTTTADITRATGLQAPSAPTLQSKTSTSVTLTPNTEQEFSKDNGTAWQTSNVFTGLSPSTQYSFITRAKDDANHEASPASAALTVKTDASSSGGGPSGGNRSTSSTGGFEIPSSFVSNPNSGKTLKLGNDFASVTIPSDMLDYIPGIVSKKAEISIGQGDKSGLPNDVKSAIGNRPLISLSLLIDDKQTDWSNPDAPVTVSIHYTPTTEELAHPESIVVWYIDGSGDVVTIPNGHYDPATGMVTFDTTHFSDYAVAYNPVSFSDVAAGAWYHDAVNFIAARGITDGTGNGKYSPEAKLTRGEFLVLMMRAYGIEPDTNPTDNFADAGSTYYTGYLATAKRLGISAGIGNNIGRIGEQHPEDATSLYAPDKEITRQEMCTMLYNTLKVIGQLPEKYGRARMHERETATGSDQPASEADVQPQGDLGKALSDFTDANSVADWAEDAMTLLVKTGTIGGSNGKLNPFSTTTRAEMAQVLYNLLTK